MNYNLEYIFIVILVTCVVLSWVYYEKIWMFFDYILSGMGLQ